MSSHTDVSISRRSTNQNATPRIPARPVNQPRASLLRPAGSTWLADSPVLIDGHQVGAFYEAVVGPAFRTVELQVTASWAEQLEKSTAGHLNAGLSALFPWLKADADADTRRAATRARQDGQSVTLQPVDSAARQLVQLSLHYLVNQPGRIRVVNQDTSLPGAAAIAASPRMIAFVDIPPGTRFMPQAAELNDGRVVTFFSPLIEKLKRDGGTLPVAYPEARRRMRAGDSVMPTGTGSPTTGTPTRRSRS
jgi:hypothetical protein